MHVNLYFSPLHLLAFLFLKFLHPRSLGLIMLPLESFRSIRISFFHQNIKELFLFLVFSASVGNPIASLILDVFYVTYSPLAAFNVFSLSLILKVYFQLFGKRGERRSSHVDDVLCDKYCARHLYMLFHLIEKLLLAEFCTFPDFFA